MGAGASGPSRTIHVQSAANKTSSSPSPSPPPLAASSSHQGGAQTPPLHTPKNLGAGGDSGSSAFTPTTAGHPCLPDGWQWEYEEFPGGPFRAFEANTSEQLEAAYAQRKMDDARVAGNNVSVLLGGRVLHTVNVVNMKAVGPGGASRPVRRVNPDSAATVLFASEGKARPRGSVATEVARQARDPLLHDPSTSDDTNNNNESNNNNNNAEEEAQLMPTLHSIIKAHQSAVYGITFGSEGNRIVTGAKDGSCKHWEVDTSFLITEFEVHPGSVLTTAMSQNNAFIATGCDDDKARVFAPKERHPRAVLEGHEHKVYSIAFTCDGKHLVTTSMDDTLKVWDLTAYTAIRSVAAHRSSIFSMQASYLCPHLGITAGDDSLLISHDFRLNNTVTARYSGHQSTLWGCDIRFDDGQFISCGMDATVCLWDPRNPSAPYNVVRSHKNPVHCVEYMPDGRTFLSSARDRSFRLTVANSGKEVFHCVAHEGNVYRVTYNAATSRIMTCGSDALVKLWTLPPLLLNSDE